MLPRAASAVELRILEIRTQSPSVFALVFCFATEGEAKQFFAHLYAALASPRRGPALSVSVRRTSAELVTVSLRTHGVPQPIRVDVVGADASLVDKVVASLQLVEFYVILSGFGPHERFELLAPRTFKVFKADLEVDGQVITGSQIATVRWNELFEGWEDASGGN